MPLHQQDLKDPSPALDAEKIGGENLENMFLQPPDMPDDFSRSTLLVAARGAGKTMLLRKHKRSHDHSALYGDLGRKILNAVSADTGTGGLTFDEVSPHLEGPIHAKTAALLAVWLFEQAPKIKINPNLRLLRRVLPPTLRNKMPSDEIKVLDWLLDTIPSSELSSYDYASSDQALFELLDDFSQKVYEETRHTLLLLLDRAEEIPYASLPLVLSLLDQTHHFKTVIACRPGLLGPNPVMNKTVPIPGDHYDIRHLGINPYSSQWRDYLKRVLVKWLPKAFENIPQQGLDLILNISRDSIRFVLDIAYRSLDSFGRFSIDALETAIQELQEMLQNAMSSQLRLLNKDALRIVKKVRNTEGYHLPVRLKLKTDPSKRLFYGANRLVDLPKSQQFFRLGLRTSLFSMIHGASWHPYSDLHEVEITPIFIWKKDDSWEKS